MISPDLPIMKSSEDKLNRESFAKSLADVILQSAFPTSFTVGLYGAWGSGKTSLLNMMIEQIERSSTDVVILRFNPWLCSDPKQLITQFFKQLASSIKMKKPTADTVCELADQYADLFDAASLIPYAGAAIAAAGKMFSTKARKRMNRKSKDMQGQKDEIIRTMVKENLKIIVSIDGMRPEFKQAMDSYEEFMNEYCEFMKKYAESDGTDVGLLADYASYMSKYADVVEDFEAWDDGEMSTAETAYYLDVQTRVSKKLLEVAE